MLQFRKLFLLVVAFVVVLATSSYADPVVLIIHGSVGMGHTAAANGIAADILKKHPGAVVKVKDLRDTMNKFMKGPSNTMYDIMTKSYPKFYDLSFRDYMDTGARVESIGDMPLRKHFSDKKVLEWVAEIKPDVIVSTFPSGAEVLIHLRDQGKLKKIPIGWVHTDLVDETYFARVPLQVDMAFVATPRLEESWVNRGLPADRVMASGMPLSPKIFEKPDPKAVADFRVAKGVRADRKTVLILGGSNGVGDYKLMVNSIAAEFKGEPIQIVAICGRSKENFNALTKIKDTMAAAGVDLFIEPLVEQPVLFNYMETADAIISKTGGLTPMELFYKRKPLVLLDINGGQERYNADDFDKAGLAKVTREQETVGREVKELLTNPRVAEAQIQKQIEFSLYNQPGKIADWVLSKPAAKPDLHGKIVLSRDPDYPRPKGLFWECLRLFKPKVVE